MQAKSISYDHRASRSFILPSPIFLSPVHQTSANLRQHSYDSARPNPCTDVHFSILRGRNACDHSMTCGDVRETGLNPRVARCRHIAHVLPHLAESEPNALENCETTEERWPRTSFPFILPSQVRPISAAERPPPCEISGRKLASILVRSPPPFSGRSPLGTFPSGSATPSQRA